MRGDEETSRSSSIVETMRTLETWQTWSRPPNCRLQPSKSRLNSPDNPIHSLITAVVEIRPAWPRACQESQRQISPNTAVARCCSNLQCQKTLCMRPRLRATLKLWSMCTASSRPDFCIASPFILHVAFCAFSGGRLLLRFPGCHARWRVKCFVQDRGERAD